MFLPFLLGNIANFAKRVFYSYFLRDFSIASLELVAGFSLVLFGIVFGLWGWTASIATGQPATTGTVMLAALPVILGVQLLLSFLAFDIAAMPDRAITSLLPPKGMQAESPARVRSARRCGDAP